MKKVEKQCLLVITVDGQPVAIIFYSKERDRVIYTVSKSDEDEIISLIEDAKVKEEKDEE